MTRWARIFETAITGIWRDLLQVERIGPLDNFFDLGGNSVLMVRFHQRLATDLGVTIPVVQLFERPTVRSLAESLRAQEPAARSRLVLKHAKGSNPMRPAAPLSGADLIDERARKQAEARAGFRQRALDASER